MKKNMKIILVCFTLAFLLLNGCGESINKMETSYTVKVSGSEKLKFSGHYSFVGTKRIPTPVQVEAVVPAEYQGNGVAAVCLFRKTTVDGTLKVEILKDGKVVSTSETAQPFGVVSLGKIPDTNSIINKVLTAILG
jgi:hypothetical protein